MEQELRRKENLKMMGMLAGGVGHELRNSLGAIKNASYFLNMILENPEPEVKETLEILENEVATSEKIISTLLDFARPKLPTKHKIPILEIINKTLSRVNIPKNIEVVNQLDEKSPMIVADPDQLGQIFNNLVINAVQAMPEGGQLTINSKINLNWVETSITDTGIGISKENMGKIFEPLFTTKAKGIGLGLAIIKTLVDGHRGTIQVQSQVGMGTTFTVKLPLGKNVVK
jgi:signal transduction histidine kinase